MNVADQQLIKTKMTYLKRVVFLSSVAMLFAAISNANLGIIGQFASQNGNNWVGPLSIALVFLGSGLGALYNGYIGRWKYRFVIFFGAMGWNIFLAFSVLFLFVGFSDLVVVVILSGSLICGLMLSSYYNGLNNYVNQCGKRDCKTNGYFGLNICIVQCSNIIGNALSAVLIEPLGQKTYSFVMLSLNILISLLYLLIRQFPNDQASLADTPNEPLSINDSNDNEQLLTVTAHSKKIPKLLFFTFAFSGVMISYVYSELSVCFYRYYGDMKDEQLNKLTFTTFMVEGCGEFVGGLLLALLAHKMQQIVLFNLGNSLLFVCSVVLMWQGFELKTEWLLQLAAFVVGFADCFGFALAIAISGKWDQAGISLFNFGQSFTVALLSTLYIFLGTPYVFIVYGGYLLLATIGSLIYRRSIQQKDQQD